MPYASADKSFECHPLLGLYLMGGLRGPVLPIFIKYLKRPHHGPSVYALRVASPLQGLAAYMANL
jgi:hypothetical protein